MTDDLEKLRQLEQKLESCDVFSKLTLEKRQELADAIYMCALRSSMDLDKLIEAIRTPKALDVKFFSSRNGNIFSFVKPGFRAFARRLLIKKAGGGTPNAAMGKGELLLLLLNDQTGKPKAGDIAFGERLIEVKTNGGKLGLGNGKHANAAVMKYCKKHKIPLRLARQGEAAKGNPTFDPTRKDDRTLVGHHLGKVLNVWWHAISGDTLLNPDWPTVRRAFLQKVANEHLQSPKELLVVDSSGDFRFFNTPKGFVSFYDCARSKFECRSYQTDPFAIYLCAQHVEPATR